MKKHFRIIVTGRVQGVGFRYTAQSEARKRRLNGWVKNMPDGTVSIHIEGEEESCLEFISWCQKGSGYAWVERTQISEHPLEGLQPFRVVY